MTEPKRYGAHIPNQRVKHSSKKDWILSVNEEAQRHLEIFKKN